VSIKGQTKGWRSSEFLVTVAAMCVAIATVLWEDNQIVSALAGLAGIIAPAAYSASRAMVKSALVKSDALKEVAGKKSSED
tara:strand:+ start:1288 stop:1530 length:243 start_codon:yes stop_codon:yes gene_type:complete